jgi:hypothetical protein
MFCQLSHSERHTFRKQGMRKMFAIGGLLTAQMFVKVSSVVMSQRTNQRF